MFWQAPTSLNPHFAVGAKDVEGAGILYEPLASGDLDGNVVPMPAAEFRTSKNGGIAAEGTSVTWKLKTGVQWHDGQPFTPDDVEFNWEYASDPATAATTIGSYQDVWNCSAHKWSHVLCRYKCQGDPGIHIKSRWAEGGFLSIAEPSRIKRDTIDQLNFDPLSGLERKGACP